MATTKKTTTAKTTTAAKTTSTKKTTVKKTTTAKPTAVKKTTVTELSVTGNKKIETLCKEFNKKFPYLRLGIFYSTGHRTKRICVGRLKML